MEEQAVGETEQELESSLQSAVLYYFMNEVCTFRSADDILFVINFIVFLFDRTC